MRRWQKWWLVAVLLAGISAGGCAGIISETVGDDGQADRLRIGTVPGWSTWERNPMKQDESCIMLKKESTF
jgi:hypothetical protein